MFQPRHHRIQLKRQWGSQAGDLHKQPASQIIPIDTDLDRILHTAAVIAHTGGQVIARFQRSWPWTTDIVTAFCRLRIALPS